MSLLRLSKLYGRLLGSKHPVSLRGLASELEVSTKTVYRDADLLRGMGCEIEAVYPDPQRPAYPSGVRLVNKDFCPWCLRSPGPLPQDLFKILQETAKFLRECEKGYYAPDQAKRFAEMIESKLLAV